MLMSQRWNLLVIISYANYWIEKTNCKKKYYYEVGMSIDLKALDKAINIATILPLYIALGSLMLIMKIMLPCKPKISKGGLLLLWNGEIFMLFQLVVNPMFVERICFPFIPIIHLLCKYLYCCSCLVQERKHA